MLCALTARLSVQEPSALSCGVILRDGLTSVASIYITIFAASLYRAVIACTSDIYALSNDAATCISAASVYRAVIACTSDTSTPYQRRTTLTYSIGAAPLLTLPPFPGVCTRVYALRSLHTRALDLHTHTHHRTYPDAHAE